jgi:hypothetical protein
MLRRAFRGVDHSPEYLRNLHELCSRPLRDRFPWTFVCRA